MFECSHEPNKSSYDSGIYLGSAKTVGNCHSKPRSTTNLSLAGKCGSSAATMYPFLLPLFPPEERLSVRARCCCTSVFFMLSPRLSSAARFLVNRLPHLKAPPQLTHRKRPVNITHRTMQRFTPRSAPCTSHDYFRSLAPIDTNGKRGVHRRLIRPHTYSDDGGGKYLFARPSPPPRPLRGSSAQSSRAKGFIGNGDGQGGAYRSAAGDDERCFGDKDKKCIGSGGPGWDVLVQGTDEYPRCSAPFPRVTDGERLAALLDGAWWYGDGWLGNTTKEPATRVRPADEGLSSGEEWFVDHDGGQGFDRGPSGKRGHATDENVLGGELRWPAGKNRSFHGCNERKPQQLQNPPRLRESPSGFVTLPHHTNTACQLPGVEPTRKGGGWRQCSSTLKSTLAPGGAASSSGRSRHVFKRRHRRIGGSGGSDFACRDRGGHVETSPTPRRRAVEARRRQRKRPRWDARFYVATSSNNAVAAEVRTGDAKKRETTLVEGSLLRPQCKQSTLQM